jgi:GTPase SAR1 family protein
MTPFKCLIVEGTSGVGKSTLIDALLRRHAAIAEPRRLRTLVHLAPSHTYEPLAAGEDAGTLIAEQNQRHLERIVGTIEWLHAGVQEHTQQWCLFHASRYASPDPLHAAGHCEMG